MAHFLYVFYSCQCCPACLIVCTYGHSKRVYDYIFLVNSIFSGCIVKFFNNCNSLFGSFRNSTFVECERNNHSTVFFYKRKNLFHNFLLAVYRIDKRLTVIKAKSFFHSNRVRGINLEWQVCYSLQLFYYSLHHAAFVNFRQTNIYVQNLSSFFFLGDSFVQNVSDVVVCKSLLEFLFSGWVDSLSNENRGLSEFNQFCAGSDYRFFDLAWGRELSAGGLKFICDFVSLFYQLFDKGWICSTAAACNCCTFTTEL